jgi:CheY-like chemotaxis protein
MPSSKPLHILVAEDNEFNAQLLEQLLVRRGHRVRLATNGRDALERATEGGFDLLFLDVHMPELDGFQVVQGIRERERAAGGHLPVIALTARARQEDRERCLAAGMDQFLAKPIQAATLWAAMDRVVATRTQESGARSQESGVRSQELGVSNQQSGAKSSLTPDACPGTSDCRLLNPGVLLAACGDDAVILERICRALRARLPEQLRAVQDALRERDARRLSEAAHKLCGMVGAFSSVVGGTASELEDYAGQDRLDMAGPLVEQLETMAPELMRAVDGLSLEMLRQLARPSEALHQADGR